MYTISTLGFNSWAREHRGQGCLSCNPSMHLALFSPCFFMFRDIHLYGLTNTKQLAVPSSAHRILYTFYLYRFTPLTLRLPLPIAVSTQRPTVSNYSPKPHYPSVTIRNFGQTELADLRTTVRTRTVDRCVAGRQTGPPKVTAIPSL